MTDRIAGKRMGQSSGAYGGLPLPRSWIWQRARGHCFYCGDIPTRDQRTIDHLTACCRGGTHDEANIVPACRTCNRRKDWRTLEEYRQVLGGSAIVFFGELPAARER